MAAPALPESFVHLHVHTEYSLLDGAVRIDELIAKAVKLKMPAVAMTDHGNLYGCIDFYQAAKKAKIKPIIGCELYVAPREKELRKAQAAAVAAGAVWIPTWEATSDALGRFKSSVQLERGARGFAMLRGDMARHHADGGGEQLRKILAPLIVGMAVLALLLPIVLSIFPAASFESRRWAESDHAPTSSSDDDE